MFDCHLIPYQPLSNSLGSSSLTYSLQIYCTRLTGPTSLTLWAWAAKRVHTSLISVLLNLLLSFPFFILNFVKTNKPKEECHIPIEFFLVNSWVNYKLHS